jgi:hypothetical protein
MCNITHFAKVWQLSRAAIISACGSNVCQGLGASVIRYVHTQQQESLNHSSSCHRGISYGQKGPEAFACHLTTYLERRYLVGELAQW